MANNAAAEADKTVVQRLTKAPGDQLGGEFSPPLPEFRKTFI
jgi:hypothetical protein